MIKTNVTWKYENKKGESIGLWTDEYLCNTNDVEEAKKLVMERLLQRHARVTITKWDFKKTYYVPVSLQGAFNHDTKIMKII